MKKRLFPVLLVLAIFAGCASKGDNSTTDTTSTQALPAPKILVAGPATTMINPAVVDTGTKTAGPITLTSNTAAPNKIVIAVIFNAKLNQSVTVTSSAGGGDVADFSNADGGNLFPQVVAGPAKGVTYTITATAGGKPYTSVTANGGAVAPDDTQTFTDAGGDSVTVFVVDLGSPNP